jgi:hypothetical protein
MESDLFSHFGWHFKSFFIDGIIFTVMKQVWILGSGKEPLLHGLYIEAELRNWKDEEANCQHHELHDTPDIS